MASPTVARLDDAVAPRTFGPALVVPVVAGLLAGLAVVAVAERSARVLGWFAAACVAASLLAALIKSLEGRLGHRRAVAATSVLTAGALIIISARVIGELRVQLVRLQDTLPGLARRVEGSDTFGATARELRLSQKAVQLLDELPARLAGGSPAQVARAAGTRGAAFLAGVVLTCFICSGGRRSFEGLMAWYPQRAGRMLNRHALVQLVQRAHRRFRRLLLAMVVRALLLGIAVGLVLRAAEVPGPTVCAVLFGTVSLVPGVGIWLAELSAVAMVLGFADGRSGALAILALALVLVTDSWAVRRLRASDLPDTGPAIGAVSFFAGFEMGGVGFALCLLAVAAFTVALWSELSQLLERHRLAQHDELPPPTVTVDARSRVADLVHILCWTAAAVVATRVGLAFIRGFRHTVVLVAIALVVSLGLDRVVAPVASRLWGHRAAAAGAVGGVVVLVLAAVSVLLAPVVVDRAASFGTELPVMAARPTDLPLVGGPLERAGAPATVEQFFDDLPRSLGQNSARLATAFWGATDAAVAVFLVTMFAWAFVLDGGRIFGSVRSVLPPRNRRVFDQSGRLTLEVVGRYFAGSIFVAVLAGTMSLTVGLALGVALAPLAALWITMTNLIPQIGGALGGSVLVGLGFASGTRAGVGCLIYFLLYQQIENHVIQPAIIGRAVSMSPAATMLTALVGGSAAGVPGALISVPLLGAAKTVTRHLAGRPEEAGAPKRIGRLQRLASRWRRVRAPGGLVEPPTG